MHRPKKVFSALTSPRTGLPQRPRIFSQRSRSGEICGSKSCAVREKRGDSQEGEFPLLCACRACGNVAPAARRRRNPARRSGRNFPHTEGCALRKEGRRSESAPFPQKEKNGSLLPPFIIQISLQDQCGCNRIYVFTVLLLLFAAAVQNVVCSNRGAPLVPQHDRQTGLRVERIR